MKRVQVASLLAVLALMLSLGSIAPSFAGPTDQTVQCCKPGGENP